MIVISWLSPCALNGYLERVGESAQKNGAESIVYDKILPNPICTHVDEAADIAKKKKSAILLLWSWRRQQQSTPQSHCPWWQNEGGKYWDYIPRGTGGKKPVKEEALPIIAMATTAGTGTRGGSFMVISNPDTEEKIGFGVAPVTFPVLSDCMTRTDAYRTGAILLPIRALIRCSIASEGYISNKANEMSDMFALQSVSLIAKSLAKAVDHGTIWMPARMSL